MLANVRKMQRDGLLQSLQVHPQELLASTRRLRNFRRISLVLLLSLIGRPEKRKEDLAAHAQRRTVAALLHVNIPSQLVSRINQTLSTNKKTFHWAK